MWHTVCNGGDGLTLDLADGGQKTETNDLDGVTMPTPRTRTRRRDRARGSPNLAV